ncbi:MAG: HD-GYP domain-containing protein [Polyangiaceae bacterium]
MATMQQMESAGFGDSLEERTFFKRPPPSSRLAAQVVVTQPVVMAPAIQQMESLGFGDCLEERIFFTGPPSSREPNRLARLEARKAAAGLMRAFVARGWEDEAHCERVASWSRRLARELKLTAERVLDVELGALLHDVGYIKLRHIEFAKSGPLTAGERFEMRRHAELGVALLQEIPALRRAIPLVAAHHERYDGTGYPYAVRGDRIPIDARIFHIADVYDALTTDRPYRARMSDADARAEIERGVGTHFDPVVHAAFDCIDPSEWRDLVASLG